MQQFYLLKIDNNDLSNIIKINKQKLPYRSFDHGTTRWSVNCCDNIDGYRPIGIIGWNWSDMNPDDNIIVYILQLNLDSRTIDFHCINITNKNITKAPTLFVLYIKSIFY